MGKRKTKKDEADFEIRFYEGLLNKRPEFFEALSALGDLYTQKGLYQKGLEIDQRLIKLRPDDPIVLYNLACSYSLLNDIDASFQAVKKAIAYGYEDLNYLMQDADLLNLRKDLRFQEFFLGLTKNRSSS